MKNNLTSKDYLHKETQLKYDYYCHHLKATGEEINAIITSV